MTGQVIAFCNQKGGVGKTTLTVNLAQVLADRGHRVLVVDADPQANATANLGVESPPHTLNDVLAVDPRTGQVQPDGLRRAAVPVADDWSDRVKLVAAELGLQSREQDQVLGGEARLREAAGMARDTYDYVLVDCPPNLGPLTINALVAADQLVLVTELRAASVEGLQPMLLMADRVRSLYNPNLRVAGILVNRRRESRLDQRDWMKRLVQLFDPLLMSVPVPERESVAKAASEAVPYTRGSVVHEDVVLALAALADRVSAVGAVAR